MFIQQTIASALNQAGSQTNNTGKAKSETINTTMNFLGVAKEVAETLTGKIVVAGNSELKSPDFMRERFDGIRKAPEKAESVYDFMDKIKEIDRMLKEAGKDQ